MANRWYTNKVVGSRECYNSFKLVVWRLTCKRQALHPGDLLREHVNAGRVERAGALVLCLTYEFEPLLAGGSQEGFGLVGDYGELALRPTVAYALS